MFLSKIFEVVNGPVIEFYFLVLFRKEILYFLKVVAFRILDEIQNVRYLNVLFHGLVVFERLVYLVGIILSSL